MGRVGVIGVGVGVGLTLVCCGQCLIVFLLIMLEAHVGRTLFADFHILSQDIS